MTNSLRSNSKASTGFDRLAEPVRRWIWDRRWRSLRDIQERAIPLILDGEGDLIISAATAGGKTEAAFLPLISDVLQRPGSGGFDLVYVGPLRALINDQFERLTDLCSRTELPVYPWHGDIPQEVKARARRRPSGVLLITPESLEALFVLRGLEIPFLFEGVRAIVIDELHALLDSERGMHVRSLLARLELAIGRKVRRVGLSATLGDMEMVKSYLRPDAVERVSVLISKSAGGELQAQLRGYQSGKQEENDEESASKREVAEHLFSRLRGARNLIFAGSRQNVEWYADALREISEKARIPLEFYPHHANLSREHRMDLENRLKTHLAATAVCTSTLELGIDIGNIACVAQIGAPFSVASLRQRLGRSGRRLGQPAVLRIYAIEREPGADSHPLDRLHLGLIRSIAMVELLIEGWCEPPATQALHLSTLTHQILSVIAQHGGATASRIYATLCRSGPFRSVDSRLFTRHLRHLGEDGVELVEQSSDGTLLLGRRGERLVEHYSFFAVFQTPVEFRVFAAGKLLGLLPLSTMLAPGMSIIFAGRRWRIIDIRDEERVMQVVHDSSGRPPCFGGDGGIIHDRVILKMKDVLSTLGIPAYLDKGAVRILGDARAEFQRLEMGRRRLVETGEHSYLVATWSGTVKTATLALALRARGHSVETHDGFINVGHSEGVPTIQVSLEWLSKHKGLSALELLEDSEIGNLNTEKYHKYMCRELLLSDACSSRLDFSALPDLSRKILGGGRCEH